MKKNDCYIYFEEITKYYPNVIANNKITLGIEKGTVHTILGENGAGKTTLMKILSGCLIPDDGKIFISNKEVHFKNSKDAIKYGIGMVPQNFSLFPNLTVSENLALSDPNVGCFYQKKEYLKYILGKCKEFNVDIDPSIELWKLSYSQQQKVAILRLLIQNAEILILDEPTSFLTPQESDSLLKTMCNFVDSKGKSVIFITHKLREAIEYADIVSVLKQGKLEKTIDAKDTTIEDLASYMMGKHIKRLNTEVKENVKKKKVLLRVENLKARTSWGETAFSGICFDVHFGEILGVAGVSGSGHETLVNVLYGLQKPIYGKMYVLNDSSKNGVSKNSVRMIPADRYTMGTACGLSIEENLMLKDFDKQPYCSHFFLNKKEINKRARKLISVFGIKASNPKESVTHLSGGNLQKVILARELSGDYRLLVSVNCTSGLDVGSVNYVHEMLIKQTKKGIAIIYVSEDIDELLKISDRILVMCHGEISGIVNAKETSRQEIGLMMGGEKITNKKDRGQNEFL